MGRISDGQKLQLQVDGDQMGITLTVRCSCEKRLQTMMLVTRALEMTETVGALYIVVVALFRETKSRRSSVFVRADGAD